MVKILFYYNINNKPFNILLIFEIIPTRDIKNKETIILGHSDICKVIS